MIILVPTPSKAACWPQCLIMFAKTEVLELINACSLDYIKDGVSSPYYQVIEDRKKKWFIPHHRETNTARLDLRAQSLKSVAREQCCCY